MVAAARWAAQQSRGTNADTAASWNTSHTVAHTRTRRLAPVTLPIVAHGWRPWAGVTIGAAFPKCSPLGFGHLFSLGFLACTLGVPFEARAGQSTDTALELFGDPPPPVEPEVIARDAEGRATIRAVRLQESLVADGDLTEALYRDVPAISGFIQVEPRAGEPATARTETWLSFDDANVYVSFRCYEPEMERLVATEMRRDSTVLWQGNDIVAFVFDTFYDRRNSIIFTVNALGGRSDGQVVNERQYLRRLESGVERQVGRFDGGWTVEAVIPFKSLRYRGGRDQVWGFNAMRVKRSSNEISTLTRVPPARGQTGVQQASLAASVVGLQAATSGALLDLKPFATTSAATGRCTGNQIGGRADACWDAGLRRQVRRDPEPERRLHLQHRLRPGGSRRTAGEPDAVQPVLPGEARVLSREPGRVRLRRRALERLAGRDRRRADPVLQPAHRLAGQPDGADRGRRAADGTARARIRSGC